MKNVFLDTNILVDLIADRKPFSKYAVELFNRAEEKEINLFTSSHSIATTHYLMKKYIDERQLRDILKNLIDFVSVLPIDLTVLKRALQSNHKDFEDAIQIVCATTLSSMDCIITRNIKDFKDCEIAVLTPDEFCR